MPDMTLPHLEISRCRWLSIPGRGDERGKLNFLEFDDRLGFTVLMNGSCKVHLDDGIMKETVVLDDPGRALHIGPMVWHELNEFTPQTVILVIASTLYDESEYLRDYETFKRVVAAARGA